MDVCGDIQVHNPEIILLIDFRHKKPMVVVIAMVK